MQARPTGFKHGGINVFTEDNRVALPLQPGQWKQFIVPQLVRFGFPEKFEHQLQMPDLGIGAIAVKIPISSASSVAANRVVTSPDAVHVLHDGDILPDGLNFSNPR
jgi:hypothetical protein